MCAHWWREPLSKILLIIKITQYVTQRSAVHAILEKTTLGKLNCKIYEKKWTDLYKTCILGEIFQVELVEVEEKMEGTESRFSDGNV